jgi:hypothetical protein
MYKSLLSNQKGLAQILPILLLIAGVGLGTFLVSLRTNLIPHAQTPDPLPCADNPIPPPEASSSADYVYTWRANCKGDDVIECKVDTDCPTNTSDPKIKGQTSNMCYSFKEGNRCLKLQTSTGSLSKTQKRITQMKGYLSNLSKYTKVEDSNPYSSRLNPQIDRTQKFLQESISLGEICGQMTDQAEKKKCSDQSDLNHQKAKVMYRLTKYYAILSGRPHDCVEADLGFNPKLKASSLDGGQEPKRLYLCSGDNHSLSSPDFRFRVLSDDETSMIKTKESFSVDLNSFPNLENVSKAEEVVKQL